jgi:diguanylate cyclase (GGDEF)-like protein
VVVHHLSDGRAICLRRQPMRGGGWVSTHEDITEREKLTAELEQNHKLLSQRTSRLQAIIDNFPGGITFLDGDLRVVLANDRARKLLDLPDRLFADGPPTLESLFRFNAERGEYGKGDVEEQVAKRMALAEARTAHAFERERPDGTVVEVRGVPLEDGGFVTTYMDATERRRSQARIVHMALHDSLTDLPNRVLLNERLEHALTRVKRGEIVAVHLLDLDHFKTVNDTLGHPAGDQLLKMVTGRLQKLVRETDTVARMGGDEFAVLQVAIGQPADATALALRVIEAVSAPYTIDGQQVVIGTSVGIAVGPADGLAPDQLIRNSDLALYRAKADGRGTYRFFEPEMDATAKARLALEQDLRHALGNGGSGNPLSAAGRSRQRPGDGLRSAGALAPSGTRHDLAGRLHPRCRRYRPDRRARRMGAAHGLRGSRELARACPARRQRLPDPAARADAGAEDRRRARLIRPAGQPAGDRDHRGRPDRRRRHGARHPA